MENNNALSPQQIHNLTPQQKKQYLMTKYVKRDYKTEDIEESKKYVVYFNPSIEKTKEWTMICVCSTLDEAKKEIMWRKNYHKTGDGDLVVDNDKRFSTFRDETKNVDNQGAAIEPGQELMQLNYNSSTPMLQVIANTPPEAQAKNGFKGIGYYANIETEYHGFYKIEEIYEI